MKDWPYSTKPGRGCTAVKRSSLSLPTEVNVKLWARLYASVWLSFFCCLVLPRSPGPQPRTLAHLLLGFGLLALVAANALRLRALPVPARLQRISRATAGLALFQAASGLALAVDVAPELVSAALRGGHLICSLAILAQVSSVATAYDMWEEKKL